MHICSIRNAKKVFFNKTLNSATPRWNNSIEHASTSEYTGSRGVSELFKTKCSIVNISQKPQ